jgi:hypothetical protein
MTRLQLRAPATKQPLSPGYVAWLDACEAKAFHRPRRDRIDAEEAQAKLDAAAARKAEREEQRRQTKAARSQAVRKRRMRRWQEAKTGALAT